LVAAEQRPTRTARSKSLAVNDTNEAILYARVSTRDQARTGGGEEGYSIPHQREACQAKAQALGAAIVEEYVDAGESAKTAQRPELQRLLKDIKKRRVRYLIAHKIDRLARNREDDMAIRLMLARAGVELVSCTENITNSAHGRFLHNIMADTAEFYRENLAEEVMKGLVRKAKEGGTPFRAPLGYLNTREFVDGFSVSRVILDEERAPIVRWCLEQYATGEWTVNELVVAARARGLTTRPTRAKRAEPINPTTMHNLLRNPYYMGVVAYNGFHYEGKHPPLASPETWLRVQDVLAAHRHAGEKDRKWPHYLRGSIFCGACGGRLVYSRHRGNGGLYEYFHCVKKKLKVNNCARGGIRLTAVEDGMSRFYRTFQPSQERIGALREGVIAEFQAQNADAQENAERAKKRRTGLLDERAKLLQAHYAGAVPVDLLKTEMDRLTRALAEADTEITKAGTSLDAITQTLHDALVVAGNCQEQYETAPPAIRRQINQGFFAKLYLGQDGSVERYELTEPFRQLLDPELGEALAASQGGGLTESATTRTNELNSRKHTITDNNLVCHGVHQRYLVGDTGFEPVTSSVSILSNTPP
jgi:site-specific DNA recombinase